MSEANWLLLAVLLNLTGMIWLALAMSTHWDQVMPTPASRAPATRRMLRGLGATALLLSARACLLADRPSMALLVWFILIAASALAVALTLAWRPAWLRIACPQRKRGH